ncbi:hypothetical protein [Brassicibacter mesophilus]|uniref:hypothetical protein n=1 Tax=Brassicibacter mesophilus TaxID=745119 RepID=UPI003D1BEC9C
MSTKIIMLILLIISSTEIFFNFFTLPIEKGIGIFIKGFKFNEKVSAAIKLVFVAVFMTSVIYFIVLSVKAIALWLGISLDKSILDIFR